MFKCGNLGTRVLTHLQHIHITTLQSSTQFSVRSFGLGQTHQLSSPSAWNKLPPVSYQCGDPCKNTAFLQHEEKINIHPLQLFQKVKLSIAMYSSICRNVLHQINTHLHMYTKVLTCVCIYIYIYSTYVYTIHLYPKLKLYPSQHGILDSSLIPWVLQPNQRPRPSGHRIATLAWAPGHQGSSDFFSNWCRISPVCVDIYIMVHTRCCMYVYNLLPIFVFWYIELY